MSEKILDILDKQVPKQVEFKLPQLQKISLPKVENQPLPQLKKLSLPKAKKDDK